MKWTTLFCCSYLILWGVVAAIEAIFGVNLIMLLCFGNAVAYRTLLVVTGVCALWLLFWLIAFRPTKYLN